MWTRDVLINAGGAGGELQDAPTQNLGKPRDPELSHAPVELSQGRLQSQKFLILCLEMETAADSG